MVADWDTAKFLAKGNNRFDYNGCHVTDPWQWRWAIVNGMTWSMFQQAGQEAHGTVDNVLPPVGNESSYANLAM